MTSTSCSCKTKCVTPFVSNTYILIYFPIVATGENLVLKISTDKNTQCLKAGLQGITWSDLSGSILHGLKLFVVFGVIPSHFRYLSNDTSIQRDSVLNFPFPFPENIPYVLLKADADVECAHTCLHFIDFS